MNAASAIRILTVDDHPMLREGIAAVLKSEPDVSQESVEHCRAPRCWPNRARFKRMRFCRKTSQRLARTRGRSHLD